MVITGVFVTVNPLKDLEAVQRTIEGWIDEDEGVEITDDGTTDKGNFGYLIIEFGESEPNDAFVTMLRREKSVDDFTIYTREEQ